MIDRMLAIIRQEYYITKRSLEVIIDLFFFSSITIVVFGFVSKFLAGNANATAAYYLLIGLVLWEIVRVGQYSITVSVLWNVWSRNLSNIFVTPITAVEYLLALMLSSVIKSAVVLTILICIVRFVFGFDILRIGFGNLLLHYFNLTLFAWAIGILLTGIIFRFGTRIQALSWGFIFLFQPLSAALFPVAILPSSIQKISHLVPATYVFESARKNLTIPTTDWNSFFIAFVLNCIYLTIAFFFFFFLFKKSRQSGQFARNEG